MKAIIFVFVFMGAIAGFCIYLEISTRNFVNSIPKVPNSQSTPQDNAVSSALEVDKPLPVEQRTEQETDHPEQEMPVVENETPVNFDWTADREPYLHKESSDPFSDYLAEQEKKGRGTWIIEGMSGDELWDAELNQMIEQFGSIPAVYTVMKYTRMFNNNIPISFDEDIEWQKALVELYPNETNKRTLAFDLWRYPRGNSPADLGEITKEDIAELRAMGITVTEELTDAGYKLKISTE